MMISVKCPECGHGIQTLDECCHNCGYMFTKTSQADFNEKMDNTNDKGKKDTGKTNNVVSQSTETNNQYNVNVELFKKISATNIEKPRCFLMIAIVIVLCTFSFFIGRGSVRQGSTDITDKLDNLNVADVSENKESNVNLSSDRENIETTENNSVTSDSDYLNNNKDSQDEKMEALVYKDGKIPLLYNQNGFLINITSGKYSLSSGYVIEYEVENFSEEAVKIEFSNTYFDDVYIKTLFNDSIIDKSERVSVREYFLDEYIKAAKMDKFEQLTGEVILKLSSDQYQTSHEITIPVTFEYSFFE